MTTIKYTKTGFVIDGHSKDPVVCHGVSAISQMVANYIEDNGWGTVSQSDGHLEITDVKEQYFGNDLFRAMCKGLRDIEENYPGNIKIECKL